MRTLTRWAVAAAALVVTAGHAHGELVILKADGQPAHPSEASKSYDSLSGRWTIHLKALYAPGGTTVYEIRGNGGEIIQDIFIDVPCWEDSAGNCIPAGSPVFVRVFSDAPHGIVSIHNIEQTGTAETLLTHVQVERDLGSVTAQAIGTLEARRDIIGPITATTTDNPYRGINKIIAGRDIIGDATAVNGRLQTIEAGRHVGRSFAPAVIQSKYDYLQIFAENDVHVDLTAGINGGSGYFLRLRCERFTGTIRTSHMGSAIYTGDARITESFQGTILLRNSLAEYTNFIEVPAGGLAGQIIINAGNNPHGRWESPVYVGPPGEPGSITLTGPTYAHTAAALGGGAVGLAPFQLHSLSCSPPNGGTIAPPSAGEELAITLRHFGPVTWSEDKPVTIERRPAGAELPFTAVADTDFQFVQGESDRSRLFIMPAPDKQPLQAGYEYRIRPTDALRCDIEGKPPVIWPEEYTFTVLAPACAGDFNEDGSVNTSDMLVLLAFWGPISAFPQADLNDDGIVNVADLLMLLANWGTCSATAGNAAQPSGREAATGSPRR